MLSTNAWPRCQTLSSVKRCIPHFLLLFLFSLSTFNCRLSTSSSLQNAGFEFGDDGIERRGFEGGDQCVAGVGGVDDGVDPQAGGGVARVGLFVVARLDGGEEFLLGFLVDFFAFALELLELDFGERACGGVAAHDGVAGRGPRENKARVVGFAAHGVMSGAEAATA